MRAISSAFPLLTLVAVTTFAQSMPPMETTALTGRIEQISDHQLHLRIGPRSLTVHTDDSTEVFKTKDAREGVSVLRVGDEVRVRCRRVLDDSGKSRRCLATSISTDVITLTGVVLNASPTQIEVGDHASNKGTLVRLSADTTLGIGKIAVGQQVHIVGWNFGSQGVDAKSLAIYNTDAPVTR